MLGNAEVSVEGGGLIDGTIVPFIVGAELGELDGSRETVGRPDGSELGCVEGSALGNADG